MNRFKPTSAQLRLLANLRDGRDASHGFAPGKAVEVESNCTRNGLLRLWPFPGRGRLSDTGRKALESVPLDDTAEEARSVIAAGGALLSCLLFVAALAVPFVLA